MGEGHRPEKTAQQAGHPETEQTLPLRYSPLAETVELAAPVSDLLKRVMSMKPK